jgi:ribonuclease HII
MPENSFIEGVNDSKKISAKKREKVYENIIKEAIEYNTYIIEEKIIDDIKF